MRKSGKEKEEGEISSIRGIFYELGRGLGGKRHKVEGRRKVECESDEAENAG